MKKINKLIGLGCIALASVGSAFADVSFGVGKVYYSSFFGANALVIETDGTGTGACNGTTGSFLFIASSQDADELKALEKLQDRSFDTALAAKSLGQQMTISTDSEATCGGTNANIYSGYID